MNRKRSRLFGVVVGAMFLSGAICAADTISITLTPPLISGSPSSVLSFSGALLNTTASTVFLNSAGINLSGPFAPTDEDTSAFFTNAPLFLSSGEVTSNLSLFAITIAASYPGGLYGGTFTVLGGADGDAQDILGSTNFTVEVNSATSTAPEPSSRSLLAGASLILLFVVLAKWKYGLVLIS